MIEKLQDRAASELPALTDDEIRKHLEDNRSRLMPDRRVRVRALRFESALAAEQVAGSIRDGKTTFQQALAGHEDDPGQGAAIELSWSGLPDAVRSQLDGLQPGEISPPVDYEGHAYLLQVESWLDPPAEAGREVLRLARDELETRRTRAALESLARELRRTTPARIHRDQLPFRYVPEAL
jgi:hypothetical protein